ncbi:MULTISPECIES: hypothetical protein [Streptomyces]|uniref:Uncharacterized protein n=1 Tax=Streptomyces koelreuteriae TaxID=2838015 RepID=A0ABX8G328_9ACTN|nr:MULTISPECIES: hypothetical protein [Streptomyces]QWB27751.1 hypothetical protein KJK29_36995 [Streptomyces koelreuteriae]UUA10851.1 hypothetical protein NNW98_37210 [Streptomyces koelreuteriae]UUA18457.1 hypothetical protein NNW99_37095 [Streptomyces sp. CRCS-T-1]
MNEERRDRLPNPPEPPETDPDTVATPEILARLHALLTVLPLPEIDDASWGALVADALDHMPARQL